MVYAVLQSDVSALNIFALCDSLLSSHDGRHPAGAAFRELVDKLPTVLDSEKYQILFDFLEPYKGHVHSTNIIGLRCRDISARNRGRGGTTLCLP